MYLRPITHPSHNRTRFDQNHSDPLRCVCAVQRRFSRILAGQRLTQNFSLQQSAVEIAALEVVGETDAEQFRPVLDLYDVEVIRAALARVRAAGEIRKSKTALFRYLLGKLSKSHASR